MKQYAVRRSPQAYQALLDVWDQIAEHNPPAADRMIDRLQSAIEKLATNPWIGAGRADIAPDLRHMVVGRYLVLYRVAEEDSAIDIVRVLHGARELGPLFGNTP